ncbi:lipid asymmetry maintenance protein MlaB [Nitrospirota bacterium]
MNKDQKVADNNNTLRVKGSLSMLHLNSLRETLLHSLAKSKHVVFEIEKIEDVSFACLQLLCSTCRTAYLQNKEFTIDPGACTSFKKINKHMDYLINSQCSFAKNGCSIQDGMNEIENLQSEFNFD